MNPVAVLGSVGGVVDTLTAVLALAPATTQPSYSVIYKENDGTIKEETGLLTGVTAVAMLSGNSPSRTVLSVHIYNTDTAAVTATLKKTVSGTAYPRVNQAIPVNGLLRWTQEKGVEVITAAGAASAETVGAVVAGVGVVAVESGNGPYRKVLLTLTNTVLSLTDALAYVGLKIYDLPAGRLRIIDCVTNLTFTTKTAIATTLNSGVTVSHGIGSVIASSITLATTMMNMMPGSGESVKSFTSGTTIDVANTSVRGVLAAVAAAQVGAILDGGAGSPVDVYLNIGVPTVTDIDGDATVWVNGTIELTYINGGS